MGKWVISKEFNFCYSHRVFVQKLREDFCSVGDTMCKCRFPHGHQGLVRVAVEGDELNKQKMLCDFKELGFINDFLDGYLDHKCLVGRDDPLFRMLVTNYILEAQLANGIDIGEVPITMRGCETAAAHIIDTSHMSESPLKEYLDGIVIVDLVPTSESLAEWIFNLAKEKLATIDVKISRVDWEETPKSRATYSE
jgi:6-pyruvoyltetrahydropterin/6-carboxytetrahydropterin synthase